MAARLRLDTMGAATTMKVYAHRTPEADQRASEIVGDMLKQLVTDYIDRYNTHRPHRSLDQRPPLPSNPSQTVDRDPTPPRIIRSTRCHGLINEYKNAA